MKYFWGLDLIRFISAVMVVLFHFSALGGEVPAWPVPPAEAPMGWLSPFTWMGWIGVQIFFVLSGFVIAASARGSTSVTFLKKRAIRLLPALWISACLALTARALWGEPLGELIPAFLRTLILITSLATLTRLGAERGAVVLAANGILFQLFTLQALLLDGFENAAQVLN